jgi:rhodanese-related sulfurtransferase
MRFLVRLSFCASLLLMPFFGTAQAGSETIPATALIQPAALADMLHTAPPVILQVGFSTLYTQAHIPAAIYAGPTRSEDGIKNLKDHVAALPHDKLLVIYCGCCPWAKCPNVEGAYNTLHGLGFTNVKVLYLDQNFGADWVDKGYPVVKGG